MSGGGVDATQNRAGLPNPGSVLVLAEDFAVGPVGAGQGDGRADGRAGVEVHQLAEVDVGCFDIVRGTVEDPLAAVRARAQ